MILQNIYKFRDDDASEIVESILQSAEQVCKLANVQGVRICAAPFGFVCVCAVGNGAAANDMLPISQHSRLAF